MCLGTVCIGPLLANLITYAACTHIATVYILYVYNIISSSTLVLDSRDQQGNTWQPKNVPRTSSLIILFVSNTINVTIGTMLSQLKDT